MLAISLVHDARPWCSMLGPYDVIAKAVLKVVPTAGMSDARHY